MNILVLKVSARKAVVMADNGEFMTIPAKAGMKEGAAFEYTPQKKTWKRHAVAIAASILFCVLGLGSLGTFTVSSYIDININPGVRLAVNQWGKVVSAEAINEDGGILINEINSQFLQDPETSVKQIIDRAREDGAVAAAGHILLTISDSNIQRAQRTEAKLAVSALETVKGSGLSVDITLQKLDMESFRALRKEQEDLDDKSKSGIYGSGLWRSGKGGLFIEKAEYAGDGIIKVEFSGAVSFTGNEIITVEDLNGVLYPIKLKETDGDTLLLQCEGLKENSIYKVTFANVGTAEKALTSFLFINALKNENEVQSSPYYAENPVDNRSDDGQDVENNQDEDSNQAGDKNGDQNGDQDNDKSDDRGEDQDDDRDEDQKNDQDEDQNSDEDDDRNGDEDEDQNDDEDEDQNDHEDEDQSDDEDEDQNDHEDEDHDDDQDSGGDDQEEDD